MVGSRAGRRDKLELAVRIMGMGKQHYREQSVMRILLKIPVDPRSGIVWVNSIADSEGECETRIDRWERSELSLNSGPMCLATLLLALTAPR